VGKALLAVVPFPMLISRFTGRCLPETNIAAYRPIVRERELHGAL